MALRVLASRSTARLSRSGVRQASVAASASRPSRATHSAPCAGMFLCACVLCPVLWRSLFHVTNACLHACFEPNRGRTRLHVPATGSRGEDF